MGTDARLQPDQVADYEIMLESISAMVLLAVKSGNLAIVRRWASSLAHVGNVLLDHRQQAGKAA